MSKLDILKKNSKLLADKSSVGSGSIVYKNAHILLKNPDVDNTKELILEMFQWSEKFVNDEIQDEDIALLAIDLDSLSEQEQIIVRRKQKKANKRVKRAKRSGSKEVVITGPLWRAIFEALETDWDSGVEAISVAAAISSLMEPDHLAEFILSTIGSEQVWKPPVSPSLTHAAVAEVFDVVTEPKKRLALVKSFWEDSHSGRWWDKTAGKLFGATSLRYVDIEENTETPVATRSYTKPTFLTELFARSVDYDEEAIKIASKIKLDEEQKVRAHRLANTGDETSDVKLLLSHLKVSSLYKPTTPINQMAGILLARSESIDKSTWKEAIGWAGLYPPESGTSSFDIPEKIMKLNHTVIDGIHFQIITTGADLQVNANQMGNCTYGRKRGLEDGKSTMWRIYHNGALYNAQTNDGNKSTREIQGSHRINRNYGVSQPVQAAWNQLLEKMT